MYWGTAEYALAEIEIPGDPDREGGPHVTGAQGVMPAQGADAGGALTDYEILGVVCHERYTLGGTDEIDGYEAEFEKWCSEGSPLYAALEGGASLLTLEEVDDTIIPIGRTRARSIRSGVTAHPSARSDALVVGGGPAGASTALELARRGHRVVVLEREPSVTTARVAVAADATSTARTRSTRHRPAPGQPCARAFGSRRERTRAPWTGPNHPDSARLRRGHGGPARSR